MASLAGYNLCTYRDNIYARSRRNSFQRASRQAAEAFGYLELIGGDILGVLTEAMFEKEKEEESTFSMARLRGKGIVRGEGAYVTLRSGSRRMSTQLLTGAMSMAGLKSLLEMLEGRGPAYLPEPLLF
jgi:hypothetical protein